MAFVVFVAFVFSVPSGFSLLLFLVSCSFGFCGFLAVGCNYRTENEEKINQESGLIEQNHIIYDDVESNNIYFMGRR